MCACTRAHTRPRRRVWSGSRLSPLHPRSSHWPSARPPRPAQRAFGAGSHCGQAPVSAETNSEAPITLATVLWCAPLTSQAGVHPDRRGAHPQTGSNQPSPKVCGAGKAQRDQKGRRSAGQAAVCVSVVGTRAAHRRHADGEKQEAGPQAAGWRPHPLLRGGSRWRHLGAKAEP